MEHSPCWEANTINNQGNIKINQKIPPSIEPHNSLNCKSHSVHKCRVNGSGQHL